MHEKLTNGFGINMNCLERVIRFVERQMEADEVMTYAAHFQDCFECRDFARSLKGMLDWRESVRARLNDREQLRER